MIEALSKPHWEAMVRCRHVSSSALSLSGGGGRPWVRTLSKMALAAIKRHPNNNHLRDSRAADNLLW